MKVAIIICAALVACATATIEQLHSAKFVAEIEPKNTDFTYGTFLTQLDHFSPQDNRTAEFQYTANLKNHSPGAPLFVYINDASVFTTQWLEFGLIHDLARDIGGGLFTADHRYFRTNLPTANASFENLRFLTVEQSLADIAVLLTTIRVHLNEANAPIILWGTGYGATLATWAKQRYPHLITGVFSSSGIYERKGHSHEQYEALSRTIRQVGGDQCANNVAAAFEKIENLLRVYELEQVTEDLNLCEFVIPSVKEDMGLFFRGLVQAIVEYLNRFHYNGLRNFCRDLAAGDDDEFASFARWIRYVFGDRTCYDISYFSRVPQLLDETWGSNATRFLGARQHLFYECTQLGNFPTTVNGDTLFGRTLAQDFYFEGCNDVLGLQNGYDYMQLREATEQLNVQFGAKTPGVTNVIYTNGLLDVSLPFGITQTNDVGSIAINIPYSAKSEDLISVQTHDSVSLTNAKQTIRQTIAGWVNRPWV